MGAMATMAAATAKLSARLRRGFMGEFLSVFDTTVAHPTQNIRRQNHERDAALSHTDVRCSAHQRNLPITQASCVPAGGWRAGRPGNRHLARRNRIELIG